MKRVLIASTTCSLLLLVVTVVLAVCAMSIQLRYRPLSLSESHHLMLGGHVSILDSRLMACSRGNMRRYAEAVGRIPTAKYDALGVGHLELGGDEWFVAVELWFLMLLCSLLPAAAMFRLLMRRRFRYSIRTLVLLTSVVACFFGVWSLTAHMGTADVIRHVDRLHASRGSARVPRNAWSDSYFDDVYFSTLRPDWHYVGEATSPFPLIVTYRESWGVTRGMSNKLLLSGLHEPLLLVLRIQVVVRLLAKTKLVSRRSLASGTLTVSAAFWKLCPELRPEYVTTVISSSTAHVQIVASLSSTHQPENVLRRGDVILRVDRVADAQSEPATRCDRADLRVGRRGRVFARVG